MFINQYLRNSNTICVIYGQNFNTRYEMNRKLNRKHKPLSFTEPKKNTNLELVDNNTRIIMTKVRSRKK